MTKDQLLFFDIEMLVLMESGCSADQALSMVSRHYNFSPEQDQELGNFFNRQRDKASLEHEARNRRFKVFEQVGTIEEYIENET